MDGLVAAVINRVFILLLLIREMKTGFISVLVVQVFLKHRRQAKHGKSAIKVCGQISYRIRMQRRGMIRIFLLPRTNPDILWQQNHCGIFRSVDAAMNWDRCWTTRRHRKFGFAIAVAEDDPNQAWVAPANSDMTRTAIKGALCICRTDDGGKTWKE